MGAQTRMVPPQGMGESIHKTPDVRFHLILRSVSGPLALLPPGLSVGAIRPVKDAYRRLIARSVAEVHVIQALHVACGRPQAFGSTTCSINGSDVTTSIPSRTGEGP